jgi:hypothetical protein
LGSCLVLKANLGVATITNAAFPIRLTALLQLPSQLQLRQLLLSLRHSRPLRLLQSLRLSLMPSVWLQVPLQHANSHQIK